MVEITERGKALKDFFEKTLSIHSAFVILTLVILRYFSGITNHLILTVVQGTLFVMAASVLISVFLITRSRSDIKRRPWQMILSLFFTASVVLAIADGDNSGEIQRWTLAWAVNGYLGAMALIAIFAFLINLTGRSSPALLLPASFLMVILIGSGLLLSPRATTSGISPVDAVFTATSATCVTGLVVRDTEYDFTFIGQLVILVLVQVGGLGLMTFAAFFALSLGQNLGVTNTMNITRIMDSEFANDIKHILISILIWTLTIETIGALLLYNTWAGMENLGWSTGETVWQAIFHSVSAFCNAGFSLNSSNLEGFSSSPATSLIIGMLIVLGGLGFMLLTVLGQNWITRRKTGRKKSLPVQARCVILITAILIVAGWVFFLVFEWSNTLEGMTVWEKIGNSFLEGVSPRTAGFNTVSTAALLPPVKWFFVILMFIGASPGGTGGGVKTTTIGLLFLSLRSLIQKRKNPEIWNRRIPNFDLQRAGAVLLVGMATFGVSSILLVSTENCAGDYNEMDYIFESMSAFGTVGLSTGVTQILSTAGRWVIIITMFIGRTAPATLAAATIRVRTSRYSYPEARITIG